MLEKVKSDRCESKRSGKADPRTGTVVRKNGKVFRDRVCPWCGTKHWHGSNTCISCENAMHKKRYGYHYTKKKNTTAEHDRQRRLAEQTKRIQAQIAAIEAAGLSIDEHVYEDVEKVMAGKIQADKARKAVK